jgi:hypothetical protein
LPAGADIVSFVRNDGSIPSPVSAVPTRSGSTLDDLRDRDVETHVTGTLEAHTLRGINRHFRHLVRALGERFPIGKLELSDLQGSVDKRSKAKGRRGTLLPTTIRNEIVTLRTAWNWGVWMKIVSGRYHYDGLRYPKGDEKPPFQTRREIERQTPGLTAEKAAEPWESVYLTLPGVEKPLVHVKCSGRRGCDRFAPRRADQEGVRSPSRTGVAEGIRRRQLADV